jgi:hypothetical protein
MTFWALRKTSSLLAMDIRTSRPGNTSGSLSTFNRVNAQTIGHQKWCPLACSLTTTKTGDKAMKAKLTKKNVENGLNLAKEKEIIETLNVVVIHKNDIKAPITVKWYMGRSNSASVVYCSIWVTDKGTYISGHGSAGEYEYNKVSVAFQAALDSCGIELYGDVYGRDEKKKSRACVDGLGDSTVASACEAITRALGYRGKIRIIVN